MILIIYFIYSNAYAGAWSDTNVHADFWMDHFFLLRIRSFDKVTIYRCIDGYFYSSEIHHWNSDFGSIDAFNWMLTLLNTSFSSVSTSESRFQSLCWQSNFEYEWNSKSLKPTMNIYTLSKGGSFSGTNQTWTLMK